MTCVTKFLSIGVFSTPGFRTLNHETEKPGKTWERTTVTNLVRNGQSGTYYARAKVNGKGKMAHPSDDGLYSGKLRSGDVEKATREESAAFRVGLSWESVGRAPRKSPAEKASARQMLEL